MPTENSHAPLYRIRVALAVYVYDTFDYTVNAEQYTQAQVGARVLVSFGRQNLVGVMTEKVEFYILIISVLGFVVSIFIMLLLKKVREKMDRDIKELGEL